MKANIYLNFNGNCEEAFNFYKKAFGVEFTTFMRFKDMPGGGYVPPKGEENLVMHVSLPIGKTNNLLGSDTPSQMGKAVFGNNFSISLYPSSEEEAKKLFNSLSSGGKIIMPLSKTFWAKSYGMFTDKFGVQWMINYE